MNNQSIKDQLKSISFLLNTEEVIKTKEQHDLQRALKHEYWRLRNLLDQDVWK